MFQIPLSDDPVPNKQQLPPMIRKETGPGYPKHALVANRKTRCERCAFVVWQQFPFCERPCPRGDLASATCWHVCIFCGAMRYDPLPVMRDTRPLQPCICDHKGRDGWGAAQAAATARCTKLYRK